ncbi:MAG: amidophosphoribosyltransferase [Candidatus Nezhaarchaeota archaeon]|nr:amidophosphoribosyltransferase [Candidatus Nezhaarchaeota archaeon]
MAGIVGIYAFDELWRMARFIYYALLALQHRGQEACGIATFSGGRLYLHVASGTVDRVFSEELLASLPGWAGVGCVTPQLISEGGAQPALADGPVRLGLCLNGKILNAQALAKEVGLINASEAEVFAKLLSRLLAKLDPLEAVKVAMERALGPYSFVAITERGEMIAARDPSGLKPLAIGSFGFDYGIVASESSAMDVVGAEFKADVEPGEAYVFTPYSIERRRLFKPKPRFCSFEYVYLARPDSVINERSVYEVRARIGEALAREHPVDADVVIGVPETAIPFAMAYSNATKIPIAMGFVRTGPHVRSAIKPTQFERLVGVQLKLNPVKPAIKGKRIVLIDDSVVRGNTTKNTVLLMRNRLGVKEVHVRIGSPRLIAQCPFGIEVPPRDELIAAHLSDEEVAAVVGADSFHWLSLSGLVEAIGGGAESLCLGCFTGSYPFQEVELREG